MHKDCVEYYRSCVECAIVKGTGRVHKPPLHPIPVQRPFQIIGVDVMELPVTQQGNRYVIVFRDFLTKWPLVYPAPDQKSIRIAKLLAEEVVPMFGVPESLLSDRGTNLLSHLMKDVCELLGVTKLNTTAYQKKHRFKSISPEYVSVHQICQPDFIGTAVHVKALEGYHRGCRNCSIMIRSTPIRLNQPWKSKKNVLWNQNVIH